MAIIQREGVDLFYQEEGQGAPPLVFIHGMTCDHNFFLPQAEHFAPRHRVLSLDLRGHGQSGKPEQEYSIEGFAADTAWLCGELGLERVIAVGHSMGGAVALQMAGSYPELVRAAAVLDTTIISSAQRRDKILPAMKARMSQPGYREAFREFFGGFFIPSDDPELRVEIFKRMLATPQPVIEALFDTLRNWDGVKALAGASCPLLYVGAANPLSDSSALKKLKPSLVTGQVVGSGHFLTLQAPEQVNAMLERFIYNLVPSMEAGD